MERSHPAERLPVVAIVGRPNVGKSTLFNRLVGRRKAIVGDRPGVTVDRLETDCRIGERAVTLIDTGGIGEPQHGEMQPAIDAQVEAALEIADVVLFVVDGAAGATPVDATIAEQLRRQQIPVMLVVNKAERAGAVYDFYALGVDEPVPISAIHGEGMAEFRRRLERLLPAETPIPMPEREPRAWISVLGRPNVGKSTLINAWLGSERMVVSAVAGTTRDAIDTELAYGDDVIRLVDTAGQRRHARIHDVIEFVARVKAKQALHRAQAGVLVLDGEEGIVEQDMRLMTLARDEGCALVVAVNKVDLLDEAEWRHLTDRLDFRMRGLPDIPVFRISALKHRGVRKLLGEAVRAAERNGFRAGTGELNRWLERAQRQQPPPSDDGAVVRLKYATQTATQPPTLKVFCNRPGAVRKSYVRYLEQSFRKHFRLPGVPVRILFSVGENPYASGKRRK